MDELKWELLTEVQGRWEADIIKAYLAGHGIDSELFQEALAQFYPTALDILGRVQIFVSKKDLKAASKLLEEYLNPEKPKASKRGKPKATNKRSPVTASSRKKTTSKTGNASKRTLPRTGKKK